MNLKRTLKHLLTPPWVVARAFPQSALEAIATAIQASEKSHNGELRFAVEAGLDLLPLLRGQTARQRAEQVFGDLRVWDTECNSGVLIYIELVDHRIEIVADRGISAKVTQPQWDTICHRMEEAFKRKHYQEGVLTAIDDITLLLAQHFPPSTDNPDELSNEPVVL